MMINWPPQQGQGSAGWLIAIAKAVIIGVTLVDRRSPEQLPDPSDIGRAVAISEEAIVTDTVLAFWEDVDGEPTDELGHSQRHGGVAACAFKAVIFDAEGDAVVVHADQAAVGDGDTVSIARQICQDRLGSGVPCCTDQLQLETRPTRDGFQAVRSKCGRPSPVIRFRIRTPILTSVFRFSKLRAFSLGPITVFQRPMRVSPRLR